MHLHVYIYNIPLNCIVINACRVLHIFRGGSISKFWMQYIYIMMHNYVCIVLFFLLANIRESLHNNDHVKVSNNLKCMMHNWTTYKVAFGYDSTFCIQRLYSAWDCMCAYISSSSWYYVPCILHVAILTWCWRHTMSIITVHSSSWPTWSSPSTS